MKIAEVKTNARHGIPCPGFVRRGPSFIGSWRKLEVIMSPCAYRKLNVVQTRRLAQPLGVAYPYGLGADASLISEMTMACEPPFKKVFPVTVTRLPARGNKRSFCPVAGMALEMGQ